MLSVESIYNYLEWLEKAFVIYRCPRYDLKGKSVLKTQEKFYLADASLKYCMMGFQPESVAAMLENVVYFELKRKGYEVYIGKNETKEIDFVAVRRGERLIYYRTAKPTHSINRKSIKCTIFTPSILPPANSSKVTTYLG